MIAVWVALAVIGLGTTAVAAARGVDHAARAAAGLGVPPFLIGVSLVALGTDVPEIANSIIASIGGHGDINVGDSIGSAAAQATLVVGVMGLVAPAVAVPRRNIGMLGVLSVLVLLLGAGVMLDGNLARVDGVVLVVAWAVATAVVWRLATRPKEPELPLPEWRPWVHVVIATISLVFVALGATVAVVGITRVAGLLAVPEYLISFFGQALGTSLPELTVAITAARRHQGDLALGNAFGATLADASLSLGIGPLVAPTAITAALAVRGALLTAGAVGLAILVLVAAGRHNKLTGAVILLIYVGCVPLVIGV